MDRTFPPQIKENMAPYFNLYLLGKISTRAYPQQTISYKFPWFSPRFRLPYWNDFQESLNA